MSRNIMAILQWLPLEKQEDKNLFLECKDIKKSCSDLCVNLSVFLKAFKLVNCSILYYSINTSENKLLFEVRILQI